MERMKIEIEKSEYDRLKSREEKLEDIYKENRELRMDKARLKALSKHKTDMVMGLGKLKDELEEENKKLKEDLDKIEEIKDRELIKLLNENERLSKELEKKEKSLRVWRKLKK